MKKDLDRQFDWSCRDRGAYASGQWQEHRLAFDAVRQSRILLQRMERRRRGLAQGL